ncbi:Gfo/Idh/MocA family oxidoreductase [Limimaricola cinnabarinus]|uniref:Gfo/Idh/MocA family oxidoreductase n=1 Tax=Limimaricola cinnabarinus TaxID=1125964 RepID=UPI00190F178B|nr:Gfo/Idh/MocA family oxidoreductase [Limimaricola cinnabarinus]
MTIQRRWNLASQGAFSEISGAIWLFGPAVSVHAHLDMADLAQGPTDAGFIITLRHESGACSQLSSSKINRLAAKEYVLYGESGSYSSSQSDVQAQSVFAGRYPAEDPDGWGFEDRTRWGTLRTAAGEQRIPSEQGRYHDYYEGFARAVWDGTEPPVSAEEAMAVLAVLDAAWVSAEAGREVKLDSRN